MQKKTAAWQKADRHYWHPFSDNKELRAQGSRLIVRGDGVHVWDSEGRRLLDGMSGLWCVNLGYGRAELVDAAARQMRELPYYNSFFKCANPPAVELAAKLAKIAPRGMGNVFFTGSGSESIDTATRIVRRYWQLRGRPQRNVLVARVNAYHGSSVLGVALGGMRFMQEQGVAGDFKVAHVAQPYAFGAGIVDEVDSPAARDFAAKCAKELDDKIRAIGPGKVAAFFGEPVQGAGGVIIPPDNYWPEIEKVCKKHGVLIVSDEVICGFGRLGRWFGAQHFGFRPHLITAAKGLTSGYLPLGAVIVDDEIGGAIVESGGEFAHGYTYGGHPVCAAVALENLRILESEKIIDHARQKTAPYLQKKFAELRAHPLVAQTRGLGMLAALELKRGGRGQGATGTACRDCCWDNGIIMRATRDTMFVSPPLVISRAQIDEMIEKISLSLDSTAAQFAAKKSPPRARRK